MSEAHLMEELTVREVDDFIKRNRVILVPLGVCEQHGYHLPLSTDSHNAVEFSRRASARTGALVAPVLNYTFSGGTLPGTVNIRPATVSLVVEDILTSLSRQGFRRIVLVPGHGGTENEGAIRNGIDSFLRSRLPDKCVTVALYLFWKDSPINQRYFAEKDFHAGCVETSLMMYWRPELVGKPVLDAPEIVEMMKKNQDAYQVREKPVDDDSVLPYIYQHPGIKIGVMGFPEKAGPELGETICREVVDNLAGLIERLHGS